MVQSSAIEVPWGQRSEAGRTSNPADVAAPSVPDHPAMKLLIVEDNRQIVANVFEYFEARGHVMDAAPDGLTGLYLAVHNDYDAIILDWMLPRIDGPTLAQRLRVDAGKSTPIVMLTARDDLSDKLGGFHAGADDYLTKPFALPELEVRLLALVARAGGKAPSTRVLRFDDVTLNLDTHAATRAGVALKLYPAGRKLLECLMRAAPSVVPRERLEQALWGDEAPDSDLLRSHLYELRRAVDGAGRVKLIHTVPSVGCRMGTAAAHET
jgi:DNA-binding response OmpR family regulator